MNLLSIALLIALVIIYLVETAAKMLNLRSLNAELPEEFVGVYDPDTYARSQKYTQSTTRFAFVQSIFEFVLLIAFWLLGGFNILDLVVRSFGFSPFVNGLIYVGILALGNAVLTMPFDAYGTFVIEEKFGFNKTTLKTFIVDRIKGFVLATVIGGAVLSAILAFFLWAGSLAWLYAWGGLTVFMLAITFIAPTWIMPLFNKFTPLEEGELRTAIFDYAKSVSFPLTNIYVMDGSKRSSKSNAFFTGFGKNKRIALFDNLIAKHSVAQLVAILAHEIGHYKKRHITIRIVLGVLQYGVVFYLFSLVLDSRQLFDAFRMDHMSVYAGLVFFGILYSPLSFILSIFLNLFSRRHEFQADQYAVKTTGPKEHLIGALKTLSLTNLSNLTPHPFYVLMTYSHPPVLKRIEAIERADVHPV
jgi:STE24 endopeptidase